jgi:P-type E1-E2 ATPase
LAVQTVPQVVSLLSQGRTVFCVSLGEDLLAVYGLDDSLRSDAKSVVSQLQKRDIAVSLVSGDDDGAVQEIGRQLGIPGPRVKSRCSPGDKQKYIKAIIDHKDSVVLFCGDGTNDAVAFTQANIGLHMNSGTDVA